MNPEIKVKIMHLRKQQERNLKEIREITFDICRIESKISILYNQGEANGKERQEDNSVL